MKKILLFASALAGLFFTSCQKENLEPQAGKTVTFTIEAPAAMQTRAIADGKNVDQLIYEVWITGQSQNVTDLSGATRLYQAATQMTEADGKVKATITLDLVNDQNFTVLFWAQKEGINVYNTAWLNAVTYTNTAANAYSANDNRLDAFYGKAFVSDGQTATPTVTLKRPFAQVNLCTLNSKDAAQTSDNYNISLVSSKMALVKVPTVFNVATSAATEEKPMEFAANTVPSGEDKMITVNGKQYFYAGMNYVFAGSNITLTYDIQTKLNGTVDANVNNTIQNVPLKENYRTNIVGNLLTSKVDYEIIVDAEFNTPAENVEVAMTSVNVNTLQELQEAINNAELGTTEIVFGADIEGEVTILQKVGVNLVINGVGKKFDGTFKLGSGPQGGTSPETLTFKNINFEHSAATDHDFIWADDAKTVGNRYAHDVTVDNCTFTGNRAADVVAMRYRQCFDMIVKNSTATGLHSLMWASGGNGLTIDNVTVENSLNGVHFGTSKNVVIRNSDLSVDVYGIRADGNDTAGFKAENTSINATQPVIVRNMTNTYNVELVGETTLITDAGYQVIFTNGKDDAAYVVPTGNFNLNPEAADKFIVFPYERVAATAVELKAALTAVVENTTIYLIDDITVTDKWDNRYTGGKTTVPVTIDGLDHTLKFTGEVSDSNYSSVFRFENVATVKNLTIDLSETTNTGQLRAISSKSALTVEDCTFIGKSTINSRGIIFGEGATNLDFSVSITNSEFTDWKRGITDNENAKDVRTVTISNNNCTNAHIYISAFDTMEVTGNEMNNSAINITSYTSASTAKVTAIDNILDANQYNVIGSAGKVFSIANVNAQEGFTVNAQ